MRILSSRFSWVQTKSTLNSIQKISKKIGSEGRFSNLAVDFNHGGLSCPISEPVGPVGPAESGAVPLY